MGHHGLIRDLIKEIRQQRRTAAFWKRKSHSMSLYVKRRIFREEASRRANEEQKLWQLERWLDFVGNLEDAVANGNRKDIEEAVRALHQYEDDFLK